ncbi:MAG: putative bifunctional diguanylate cyclase/phosphodiesterase [Thermoanaerobaculaceae bacterium]
MERDFRLEEILRALLYLLSGSGVEQALATLGEGVDVDRVYIFSLHPHPKTGELACSQLYEWCRPGVEPQIDNPELQNLPIERAGFGRWLQEFREGQLIFGRVDDFPESVKPLLQGQSIKSILVAPIKRGEELWGFMGFDSVARFREWGERERELLLLAAACFGAYLLREVAHQELKKAEDLWRNLLAHIPDALVVHDGKRVLFANPAASRLFGLPEGESLVDRLTTQLVHGSSLKLVEERVMRMLTLGQPAPLMELAYTKWDGTSFLAETRSLPVELGGRRVIVSVLRDLSERKRWLEQIHHLAYHDNLTDLPNRSLLRERAKHLLTLARRHKFPLALGYLDLNRFKEVNDALGHDAGDDLLRAVAIRLARVARETDTVARLGGDEFAILWPQTGHEGARVAARRVLECFEQPFLVKEELLSIEASLGIAVFPSDGEDLDELMRSADVAMYRAKGTNCGYAFYSPESDRYSRERLTYLEMVKRALREKVVRFHFQPILCAETGQVRLAEALARLEQGDEVIPASRFVPLLHEVGLVVGLDRLALQQAAAAARQLGVPVSVNVAGPSLLVSGFVEELEALLRDEKLGPGSLWLEVTESFFVQGAEEAVRTLREVRKLGVPVALDDFGNAYSSLALLRDVAPELIKLDASFVKAAGRDERSRALLVGVIELAHRLQAKVVAEGVEDGEQREFLRSLGCDFLQGLHFAPALPVSDPRWLSFRS